MDVNQGKEKEVNGLKEDVLEEIYYSDEGLSNKDICDRLGEKTGNISYATKELKKKDLIKDTEIFEGDKTCFKSKDDVNIQKDVKYHRMMNTSAYIKIIEGIMLFFYAFWLHNYITSLITSSAAVLLGMLAVFSPSMAYTIFRLVRDEDNYEIHVYKQSTEKNKNKEST